MAEVRIVEFGEIARQPLNLAERPWDASDVLEGGGERGEGCYRVDRASTRHAIVTVYACSASRAL